MKKLARLFFVGGLFFVLDQILKYFSHSIWAQQHLLFKFFGWYPFQNTGAAFGVPLPALVIIIPSLVVVALLIYLLIHENYSSLRQFGLVLIIGGALSNLLDRIFFGYTVDYLLILTGVINLADVMIALGFLIYLLTYKKGGYVSQT